MNRPLLVTSIAIGIFLVFGFVGLLYVTGPGTQGATDRIYTSGKLLLYRYSLVKAISLPERKFIYTSKCTRKCHSKGVVEQAPKTSREWDTIVGRMSERAGIIEPEISAISAYLKENFLSTVPTVLSDELNAFLKTYLWRFEFGTNDIYIDMIYVPEKHYNLMPYLGVKEAPKKMPKRKTHFIVFINTHQSELPPWDLSENAVLKNDKGIEFKGSDWKVVYHDPDNHHKEGILTFPKMVDDIKSTMELSINIPGLREKKFQWKLPIPSFNGKYEKKL